MASPVVESRTTGTDETSQTSHSITLPSTIAEDDLIFIVVSCAKNGVSNSWPTGWVEVEDEDYLWNEVSLTAAYLVADGTEDGNSITLTTSAATKIAYVIYRISGADSIVGATTPVETYTSTPDPPSLSPSGGSDEYLWIEASATTWGNYATAASTNYSNLQVATNSGGNDASIGTAERANETATENPGTMTTNVSDASVTTTFAVYPKVTALIHTFEGETDETTITTSTGEDDVFGAAYAGTAATKKYDTARSKEGSASGRFQTGATLTTVNADLLLAPSASDELWASTYLYRGSSTAANSYVFALRDSAGIVFVIRLRADDSFNLIQAKPSWQIIDSSSAGAVPTGEWIRFDIYGKKGASSNAVATARLFSGANLEKASTTANADVELTSSTRTADYDLTGCKIGIMTGIANSDVRWFDDNQISNVGWPSPTGTAVPILEDLIHASESEAAQTITVVKPIVVSFGLASESEASQVITVDLASSITESLLHATESETAQGITADKPITEALGSASETEVAQTIEESGSTVVSLGHTTEDEAAQTISTGATTVDVDIAAGADDGYRYGTSFTNSVTWWVAGHDSGVVCDAFMRFDGVTIPDGATIISAKIDLSIWTADSGFDVNISVENSSDPSAPTTESDLSGRTRTTENTNWTSSSTGASVDTPDFTDAIQELVDDQSGLSNEAVLVLFDDNGSSTGAAVGGSTYENSYYASLIIEYQVDSEIVVSLVHVSETEAAQTITADKPVIEALGNASEAESGQTVAPIVPIVVGVDTSYESDSSQSITVDQAAPKVETIGAASESESAVGIAVQVGGSKFIAIGVAMESETAQETDADKAILIGIGMAVEDETTQTIVLDKAASYQIVHASETELSHGITVDKAEIKFITLGTATESEISVPMGTGQEGVTFNVLSISPVNNPSLDSLSLTTPESIDTAVQRGRHDITMKGSFFSTTKEKAELLREALNAVVADHQRVNVIYPPESSYNGSYYITNARVNALKVAAGLYGYSLDLRYVGPLQ